MDSILALSIIFTFILSVISISYLIFKARKRKQKIVKSLLFILISLNSIWYIVLIIQSLESGAFMTDYKTINLGLQNLFSSLLFLSRFIFLMAFFQMVIKILNFKFSKTSILTLKLQ